MHLRQVPAHQGLWLRGRRAMKKQYWLVSYAVRHGNLTGWNFGNEFYEGALPDWVSGNNKAKPYNPVCVLLNAFALTAAEYRRGSSGYSTQKRTNAAGDEERK